MFQWNPEGTQNLISNNFLHHIMEGRLPLRFCELKLQPGLPLAEEQVWVELQSLPGLLHALAPPLLGPRPPPEGEPLQPLFVALAARTHVGLDRVAPQLLPGAVGVYAAADGGKSEGERAFS